MAADSLKKGMMGAGLGIDTKFIAGTVRVMGEGRVYMQSHGQKDGIILTDIIFDTGSVLMWIKDRDEKLQTRLRTNWFGEVTGWCVITINPVKSKATNITPENFMGFELTTGKTFIGDNDTHFRGNNGYAVAIPGTVYEWEVTDGNGTISHNVPVSTSAPAGQKINAYGMFQPEHHQ